MNDEKSTVVPALLFCLMIALAGLFFGSGPDSREEIDHQVSKSGHFFKGR